MSEETNEQISLFQWIELWVNYCQSPGTPPPYSDLEWVFHCPNGEHRVPAVARKLKQMGVKPGVSDVLWLRDGRVPYRVDLANLEPWVQPHWRDDGLPASYLAIEMKGPTGSQTPRQKAFQKWVEWNDGLYLVARNWVQAARLLCLYSGWEDQPIGRSLDQWVP